MSQFLFVSRILAICGLIFATSCEPNQDAVSDDSKDRAIADLKEQIEALKQSVAAQGTRLSAQDSRIGWMELQLEWLQNKSVSIDPVTPGYQVIDSNAGRFLIACDDVHPYLDGQKLKLRIGNPNLITYSGFKLKAQWGSKSPSYPTDGQRNPESAARWQVVYSEWKQSLREKEIESTAELKPGLWNTVEVILSPAKSNELGYIQVSMTTDKVRMPRDKQP